MIPLIIRESFRFIDNIVLYAITIRAVHKNGITNRLKYFPITAHQSLSKDLEK